MTNLFRNKSTHYHENCTPSSIAHSNCRNIKQNAKFIIMPSLWY